MTAKNEGLIRLLDNVLTPILLSIRLTDKHQVKNYYIVRLGEMENTDHLWEAVQSKDQRLGPENKKV